MHYEKLTLSQGNPEAFPSISSSWCCKLFELSVDWLISLFRIDLLQLLKVFTRKSNMEKWINTSDKRLKIRRK